EKAARWVLALAACTLILTFSRAGIACAFLGLAIVAVIERRRIVELVPAVAGALFGTAGALTWWALAPTLWHGRLITWPYAGGVGYRSELWRAALYFFRNHPILGIGAGNFELELPEAGVVGVRTHANNWFLQALAEGGVVLLTATIAWIVTLFWSLTRDVRRSPWRIAAFAASVALVAHQSVDYLVFYPKVAESWIALIALAMI
ncbi:MAG: O-antigen ligase family protein, partial [Candidatus Aquilonibacter sp.]